MFGYHRLRSGANQLMYDDSPVPLVETFAKSFIVTSLLVTGDRLCCASSRSALRSTCLVNVRR
jgi:hypothetical protein